MTASKPDLYLPVDAAGQLRLEGPGGKSLDLVADGGALSLDVDDLGDLKTLLPRSTRSRRDLVSRLATLLRCYGLTFTLRVGNDTLLELGDGVRPSWLARLVGLGPARLPLTSALRLLRALPAS